MNVILAQTFGATLVNQPKTLPNLKETKQKKKTNEIKHWLSWRSNFISLRRLSLNLTSCKSIQGYWTLVGSNPANEEKEPKLGFCNFCS